MDCYPNLKAHVFWQYIAAILMVHLRLITSAEVTNIQVEENAVKGQQVVIVCSISNFNDMVDVRKGDSQGNQGPSIFACNQNSCIDRTQQYTNNSRYNCSPNANSIRITIINCNRLEDQTYWSCASGSSSQGLFLTIYTMPEAVSLTISPNIDIDLSLESVKFTCVTTNCVSPAPNFTWYYTEAGQNYSMPGTVGNAGESCPDKEQKYTYTLTLERYTTSSDNRDKTVNFRCGIKDFPGLSKPLISGLTSNVRFAVHATTPVLDNKTADGLVVMLANITKILTCTTSLTRPAANVSWAKGNVFLETVHYLAPNGTNGLVSVTSIVTFTPQRSDNNTDIVCITAIPGQAQPTSEKGTLMILWPPSIPTITLSDRFPWQEGSSYSLNCSTTSEKGNPAAAVTWHSRFGTQESSNTWKLIFTDVSYIQDGVNISCQLNNGYTATTGAMVQTVITLDINFPPKVLNSSNIKAAVLDGSVNFTILSYCKPLQLYNVSVIRLDKADISSFQVSWKSYPVDTQDSVANGSIIYLQINNVAHKEFGSYKLILTNAAGTTVWPFNFEKYVSEAVNTKELQIADIVGGTVGGLTVVIVIIVLLVFGLKTGRISTFVKSRKSGAAYMTKTEQEIIPTKDNFSLHSNSKQQAQVKSTTLALNCMKQEDSSLHAEVNKSKKKDAPSQPKAKKSIKAPKHVTQKNVNVGLLYADLEFSNVPQSKKKIDTLGTDSGTIYVQVDLTKKANVHVEKLDEEYFYD